MNSHYEGSGCQVSWVERNLGQHSGVCVPQQEWCEEAHGFAGKGSGTPVGPMVLQDCGLFSTLNRGWVSHRRKRPVSRPCGITCCSLCHVFWEDSISRQGRLLGPTEQWPGSLTAQTTAAILLLTGLLTHPNVHIGRTGSPWVPLW